MPNDKTEDLSNVPASVLKQQRDAERRMNKLAEGDEPTHSEEPTNVPPVNTEPEPKPIEPATEQEPVVPVTPAITDPAQDDGFQHKYNVLQGKYNSEIKNLNDKIVDLQATIERQNKVIEDHASTQPKPEIDLTTGKPLNPDDFSGWGDELQDLVRKVNSQDEIIKNQAEIIKGYKTKSVPQVDDSLAQRIESLESKSNEDRVKDYYTALDGTIKGDWRKMNTDPSFNKWLDEQDPITMQQRRIILTDAAQNFRGAQVASIFNQYLAGVQGAPAETIFEELPNGGGHGDGDGGHKPTVTEADVHKAKNDFIKGRIDEAEYDKVFAAYQKELGRQNK